MADDKVAIWGSGLKFGRKPANGELLIGNGEDMTMATLTAGAGASITNAAGAITISATGSGGTVTGVTASSPLASSGGSNPDISLTGTVGVANGGTGRSSLTANNVILGNGTSAVGLVAPGASGNVLTSDGTTWASSSPPSRVPVLIETKPSTSGSTVDFTNIPQTYSQIIFKLQKTGVGVNTTALAASLSSNNGATWGAGTVLSNNSAANVQFDGTFVIYLYAFNDTLKQGSAFFQGIFSGSPVAYASSSFLALSLGTIGSVNAVRFLWTSSGTFNNGSIAMYGL